MKLLVPALTLSMALIVASAASAADTKASAPATKAAPAPASKAAAAPATPAAATTKAAPAAQVKGTKDECEKAYSAEKKHSKSKKNFMKACVTK